MSSREPLVGGLTGSSYEFEHDGCWCDHGHTIECACGKTLALVCDGCGRPLVMLSVGLWCEHGLKLWKDFA